MLFFAIISLLSINSTLSLECCDEISLSVEPTFNGQFFGVYSKYSDLFGKYIKQHGMFNKRPYYRKKCTSKSLKGTNITRTYYLIYYQKGTVVEKGKS